MSGEDWRKRMAADRQSELEARDARRPPEGAWRAAESVRKRALSSLTRIAELGLTKDEARRSANQVAKLREELRSVEGRLREAAGEGGR